MKINNFMYTCYVVHYYLNITDRSDHNLTIFKNYWCVNCVHNDATPYSFITHILSLPTLTLFWNPAIEFPYTETRIHTIFPGSSSSRIWWKTSSPKSNTKTNSFLSLVTAIKCSAPLANACGPWISILHIGGREVEALSILHSPVESDQTSTTTGQDFPKLSWRLCSVERILTTL